MKTKSFDLSFMPHIFDATEQLKNKFVLDTVTSAKQELLLSFIVYNDSGTSQGLWLAKDESAFSLLPGALIVSYQFYGLEEENVVPCLLKKHYRNIQKGIDFKTINKKINEINSMQFWACNIYRTHLKIYGRIKQADLLELTTSLTGGNL